MDGYRVNTGGIEAAAGELSGVTDMVATLGELFRGIMADTGREDSNTMARSAMADVAGLLARAREAISRDAEGLRASAATYQRIDQDNHDLFGGGAA